MTSRRSFHWPLAGKSGGARPCRPESLLLVGRRASVRLASSQPFVRADGAAGRDSSQYPTAGRRPPRALRASVWCSTSALFEEVRAVSWSSGGFRAGIVVSMVLASASGPASASAYGRLGGSAPESVPATVYVANEGAGTLSPIAPVRRRRGRRSPTPPAVRRKRPTCRPGTTRAAASRAHSTVRGASR